jgi:mono/diheme cytochrome c family protein
LLISQKNRAQKNGPAAPSVTGTGTGEVHLFPRLAGSALVQSDDSTTLVRVVLQGTRAASTSGAPTAPAMPAFDWRLNDAQVAAVLTYIRNSWGNAASSVGVETIVRQRKSQTN